MISHAPDNQFGICNTGQYGNATSMASGTITVDARERAFGILVAIASLMLVLVMTKMLGSCPRFMLAIGSRHRPSELEWQKDQQENGKPTAHIIAV